MRTIEYSRAAWRSADIYLNYLKSAGKGRDIINVQSIERLDNSKFKLYISKKTPYVDSLEIKIHNGNAVFDLKERDAKVIAYDERQKYVIVATSSRGSMYFSELAPENITLESDLTFLVKNVKKWYEEFHSSINLPECDSQSHINVSKPQKASPEQYNSICSILNSAVSYIWGAPGTGKTQMVLSNAIVNYINNNERVLVLAPTNNALEQSLRGVIKVFDEQYIERRRVIRLGKATADFVAEYSEICEAGHIDNLATTLKKELTELEDQLKDQERFLHLSELYKCFSSLSEEYEPALAQWEERERQRSSTVDKLNSLQKESSNTSARIDLLAEEFDTLTQKATDQARYLLLIDQFAIYRKITDKYNAKVRSLTDKLNNYKLQHSDISQIVSTINIELETKRFELAKLQKKYSSLFCKIKCTFSKKTDEELKHLIKIAEQHVFAAEDKLKQQTEQLEQISVLIANTADDLEREHRIKLGTPELFSISNTLFSKPMQLDELASAFDQEFSKFNNFKIDNNLAKKLSAAEEKLFEAREKLEKLHNTERTIDTILQECVAAIGQLSEKIAKCETQFPYISVSAFEHTLEYDQLKQEFLDQMKPFESFCVVDNLEQIIAEKQEQYQNAIYHLKDVVGNKNVIACTVDYAIMHFDELTESIAVNVAHVFIDEAAYCPLIKAAICFSFDAPVTLLGDHMQLPPICEMDKKAICAADHNKLVFLWDLSAIYFPDIFCYDFELDDLYESYIANTPPVYLRKHTTFLTKTYRFGEELASILEEFVYKQGFQGNTEKVTEITVINVPRSHKEPASHQSIGEAMAISEYIKTHQLDDFVILAPYRKQRYLIEKHTKLSADNVLTIHSSQGREWDTVIISVTDAWDKFFMSSKNTKSNGLRIVNTAVSRARKNLVLVLDYDHWKKFDGELVSGLANAHTELIEANLLPFI